ncbi:MAG: DUF3047 domain-containing protein [Geobacteraceae bacterium]|nr:DUF3047 domain-containing protein [Geobacteraceae bacterium]
MALQRNSAAWTLKPDGLLMANKLNILIKMKPALILFAVMFISIPIHGTAVAEVFNVSNFSSDGLSGWGTKTFKGQTDYNLVKLNGTVAVKAHSKGTASGLIKRISLDPVRYRYLHWSWKVSGTLTKGDETRKDGDDYSARLYVVFPGRFFWQTRAINYIWANRLQVGQFIPNAYTGNTMMIAVESGTSKAGQWLSETRDIQADYKRVFGESPNEIGAVAIMTDTDNTGGEAIAWYGDISISTDK